MATEPKTVEQDEPTTTTADDNDVAAQLEKVRQILERLPGLFEDLSSTEQQEEPPIFKSFDLNSAAEHMAKCSNIIVMSGAGISTSAGIPDFRSPDTGLYSQLEKYNLPFPEAIFELGYFRENPKPFFLLAKELYPQKFIPTPTHYFIRLLNEKGKLLRTFTQNIDSLERIAGIPAEKIVEAHGTFFTAHCLDCQAEYSLEHVKEIIFKDEIPYCNACKGIIKPDIVFFGESLPERFAECVKSDFSKCDFLIIIGTSLAVAPFNNLISYVDKNCPRLLINMEPVGNTVSFWNPFGSTLMFDSPKNHRDVFHKSTCDEGVTELAKLLGWERDFTTLLQKERKLNLTETASSTKTVASSTASSTQLNTTATSTKATSSSLKPSNETTRRSISSTKSANITTRNTSSTKAAAAASSKKFPTSTKTTTAASTKKK
ncbi:unnamed protein product [Rotaria sp. Silwood1]|nr:unnamed protein product [Rotaria sp. Silwood1]